MFYYNNVLFFLLGVLLTFLLFKASNQNKLKMSIAIAKKNLNFVLNFAGYQIVMDTFLEKAWNILYKDRILIYSLEATSLNKHELGDLSKEFVKLFEQLIGPNLLEEFIFIYGGKNSLYMNIIDYFNLQYQDDEIRRSSLQAIRDASSKGNDEGFV